MDTATLCPGLTLLPAHHVQAFSQDLCPPLSQVKAQNGCPDIREHRAGAAKTLPRQQTLTWGTEAVTPYLACKVTNPAIPHTLDRWSQAHAAAVTRHSLLSLSISRHVLQVPALRLSRKHAGSPV